MEKIRVRAFLIAAVAACLLWMAGCGELSEPHEAASSTTQAVQPTPTPIATPEPTPTPTPIATPSQPIATLPPGIREEARFYADLDGDGIDEAIIVSSVGGDPFDDISLGVITGTAYDEIMVYQGQFYSAYLTQTQRGEPCVLISCDNEDCLADTLIFSFIGLTPILKGTQYGYAEDVSGTAVKVRAWWDFIGSWYYMREYELTDDFTLLPVSDMMIDTQYREPLHTIRELPVEMLANGEYVASTIPADMLLYPISDDGEGHMSFRLEDGTTGKITYVRQDYTNYIDGIEEDAYFDNLLYWS